jgi:hypothetical protein
MHPGLGVTTGRELVPSGSQFFLELNIVEELSVEGDPNRSILIAEGLSTAGEVDDREPTRSERDAKFLIRILIIRTTMSDRPGHRQQAVCREFSRSSQVDRTGDTTHKDALPHCFRLRNPPKVQSWLDSGNALNLRL